MLQVPTLRGLRELSPVESGGPRSAKAPAARSWDDRHRTAFLLLLVSLCCFAAAAYATWQLPPPVALFKKKDIDNWFETNSSEIVLAMGNELQKGLHIGFNPIEMEQSRRRILLWVVGIATCASGLASIAAMAVMRKGPRQTA